MPKRELRVIQYACPACGGPSDHRMRFNVNGFDILQCQVCGLGRTEASGFDPESYYTGDYFSGQHSDGYADYVGSEPILRREFAHSVTFIRRFCDGGRLLELGCAYGFFLKEAQPYFEVAGIELAEDAVLHARRTGLNVLSGQTDSANMQRIGDVDVIVLFDVIEHLPAPHLTLALCEHHLKPGGIVVITTGDFGSPLARLSGQRWRLMTPPQHLWFFTKQSLGAMANSLGMSLEYADHPWKFVPLSLILFQLRRILGASQKPVTTSRMGVPVNLFDAMRLVLRKPRQ